jgi:pyrimidine-nucleoside phosphorylase
MISGRALGHTGGTLDKLESIPGFRTALTHEEFVQQLNEIGVALIGQSETVTPADGKLYALRDATGTVESISLIAASIMSKKLAAGLDGLVLDVKVGSGAFMKRQVDARRLAQLMTTIARRADLRCQALITDMSQPLGYAVGNALEIMEVSQTLQNAGPADLTRISLELAARMIFLGRIVPTLDDARELAQSKLVDGSGYRKLREIIAAQGGNPQVLDRFEMLPNAAGALEVNSPRGGYISAIDAEEIGLAASMIGAGRDTKEAAIDPAVGVILEVKVGEKVEAGGVLCRLYFTSEERITEAAERIEDAFRISATSPEPRELILEVVG